ncbi:hypothetical protein ABFA07_008345 [Porites harrisoni]
MAGDIEAALKIVRDGKILEVAWPFMMHYFSTNACQEIPTNVLSPTSSTLADNKPPSAKKIKLDQK